MEEWDKWREECLSRLQYAARLRIPHLPLLLPCDGRAVIVGAAPSVTDFIDRINSYTNELDILCSINGSHDWLVKNIRPPNIHVLFEADLEDVEVSLGGSPHKDVAYYVCSRCHPNIFKQLEGYKQVLWHVFEEPPEYQNALVRLFKGEFMIAGGWVTLFRTINIATILGYRKFELFGVDSSFENSSHLPDYKLADIEKPLTIWGKNESTGELRKFTTNSTLAFQAYEFVRFCEARQSELSIRIYGDGLLQYTHKNKYPEQYLTEEV